MTERDYNEAMEQIEILLAKGSAFMSQTDLAQLRRLSLEVENYEDLFYPMPITQNVQSLSK